MISFKKFLRESQRKSKPVRVELGFITKGALQVNEQFLKDYMHDAVDHDEMYDYEDRDAHERELEKHYTESGHYWEHASGKSVYGYTGEDHYYLNKRLIGGDELHSYEGVDKSLSRFLQTAKTPHDLITYTGIKEDMGKLAKGKTEPFHIEHKGYTSTSLDRKIAETFARIHPADDDDYDHVRHVLKVHIPKGSSSAYIGHMSAKPEEKEVLIHKNARLLVHPVPDETHDRETPHHPDHKIYTWHAKLVHDGVKEVG